MLAPLLALVSLPVALHTAPTEFYDIQDIIGFETVAKNPLAKTNVSVDTGFLLDIAVTLFHWRGKPGEAGTSDKERFEWDYVKGARTSSEDFNFNKERKYLDHWQAGISFRDPNWTLFTDVFQLSPSLDDIESGVDFGLFSNGINGWTKFDYRAAQFYKQGLNFPDEAEGINSFFFLSLMNNFDTKVSVNVDLQTRFEGFKQDQTFIEESGEASEMQPFFFEKNATKNYTEQVRIKVGRKGKRTLANDITECPFGYDDVAALKMLEINPDGWRIFVPAFGTCEGKWKTPRLGVDCDDEVEL